MRVLEDFKKFIMRGNVLDLAVAVTLGAALNDVVSSLTNDIILPFVAAFGGKPNFTALTIGVGKGVIRYGSFITVVLNFCIIAFSVFVIVKAFEQLQQMRGAKDAVKDPTELDVLTEIRDLLAQR